jgi:DNA-binding CsgD family transcriptional regulator
LQFAAPLLKSFDRMSCGALLLDSSGAVLDTNAHADRILRSELANGLDVPAGEWSRNALKRLLARADGRFSIDQEAWIVVSRPDIAPLVLHAIPLENEEISGPHTILVFVDLSRRPQPSQGVLQRLFDLTPAEARLAISIGSGKTLAEIADETSLSNATLRTQLSSVFMKTQTRRQPELVALLARVAILP